jgi:hypothetical protein
MGFVLEIGFIDHFNIQLVTTLNYSAIADLHNLQITTNKNAKSFQSAAVSTRCVLVTASNSGGSSASALASFHSGSQLHRLSLLFTNFLSCSARVPVIQNLTRTTKKTPFPTVPVLLPVNSLPWERLSFVIIT